MDEPPLPLEEPDLTSVDYLYEVDPLNLTTGDLDRLTADLRGHRALWETADKTAKAKGGSARGKKVYKDAPAKGSLSLADLGLLKIGG